MRISTTTIESFRLWSQPEQDWMSEQELIDGILGKFVPTRPVALGLAFGKVLETPDRYRVPGGYRCGEFSFDDAVMTGPLSLMDRRGVFEAKGTKQYDDCTVVAKADHLIGARLIENKTTLGSFNIDKYAESCQWRFMADIFEPLSITYHVFELDDHGNGVVDLKQTHSFTLYPYAGVHEDCCDLLRRFVEYVTAKGLDAHLRAFQRQWEAA